VGVLPTLLARPLALLDHLNTHPVDVVEASFGATRALFVKDPLLARRILADQSGGYVQSPMYRKLREIIGTGLTAADGKDWQAMRRAWNAQFTDEALEESWPRLAAGFDTLGARWEAAARAGEPIELYRDMLHVTLANIFALAIGPEEVPHAYLKAFEVFSETAGRNLFLPFVMPDKALALLGGKVRAAKAEVCDNLRMLVRRHQAQGVQGTPTFVRRIASAYAHLPARELEDLLVDQVLTLLLAGHETSASVLTWLFYYTSRDPEIAARVIAECRGAATDRCATIEEALPYTGAVLDEATRLASPTWILSRSVGRATRVGGVEAKVGDLVMISPYSLHRDPRHWDRPEAFRPERFFAEGGKRKVPKAFLPFGFGARYCIGAKLATTESLLAVARLLPRFALRPLGKPPGTRACVVLRLSHPVPCAVSLREDTVPKP
jgi:cytochrome P450